MKITLDWLREHLDGDYTVADVVATLNRIGHEVEGEHYAKADIDFFDDLVSGTLAAIRGLIPLGRFN